MGMVLEDRLGWVCSSHALGRKSMTQNVHRMCSTLFHLAVVLQMKRKSENGLDGRALSPGKKLCKGSEYSR